MTDIEKLRTLLPHWVAHNAEHTAEFRTWIERARAIGQEQVAGRLEAAIQKMDAANFDLQTALEYLDVVSDFDQAVN